MKTSDLAGKALNWAVGKAEGLDDWLAPVDYCGKWEHGGPIIEREWIDLHCVNDSLWQAGCPAVLGLTMRDGPTPLIAAMRSYVASKLGYEVNVPEGL